MSIESRSRQYGRVFDHWQIKEFLGSGSGGKTAVFRLVRSDSTRGVSALKVVNLIEERGSMYALSDFRRNEYESAREECSRNAEQEVWLMDDLRGNTNIVDYLDHTFVDWSDESGFGRDLLIRMELLKDLRSELRKGRLFKETEILKVGCDICTALALCHKRNILHRDIKPENIFINKDGNYKLGDFGVSRVLDACTGAVASTGIGTYEYWPAEQMSGRYDKRVDIYSLGLVLYEMSNQNRLPFASSTYVNGREVSRRLSGQPLPAPAGVSPALAQVILKACAFDPSDRYQSAGEFLKALNRVKRAAQNLPKLTSQQRPVLPQKGDDYATALAKELGLPADIFADDSYKTVPASADESPERGFKEAQTVQRSAYKTQPAERMEHPYPSNRERPRKRRNLPIVMGVIVCLLILGLVGTISIIGNRKASSNGQETEQRDTAPAEALSETEIPDNLQESLSVVITEGDFYTLDNYPNLKTLDLSGSTCYRAIQEYIADHPEVTVTYTVFLGGSDVKNTETSITLAPNDFQYATMLENLQYLPQLTSITFKDIELTGDEVNAIRSTYPALKIDYDVELFGQPIDLETTYLDLSDITSEQVNEATAKLGLLPNLASVELNDALTMKEVAKLQDSNSHAEFYYNFTLFGQVLSTTDETVEYKNDNIGNEGEEKIRQALDILDNCSRFVLDDCKIDNEVLAGIREDFRDGPKVVWRVSFGADSRYNVLTDTDTIRAVYNIADDNSSNLRYCEDVKYMDIGHNEYLTDLSFIGSMPNIEVLIASGCAAKTLAGFENCKKLTWLELAYCDKLENIECLSGCESLAFLNLSYTAVSSLMALDGLPLQRFVCLSPEVSMDEQAAFTEIHPNCLSIFYGYSNPYAYGWRYDDNGQTYNEYYQNVVRKVFQYDYLESLLPTD